MKKYSFQRDKIINEKFVYLSESQQNYFILILHVWIFASSQGS